MMLLMLVARTPSERIADAAEKTFGNVRVSADGEPLEIVLTLCATIVLFFLLVKGGKK